MKYTRNKKLFACFLTALGLTTNSANVNVSAEFRIASFKEIKNNLLSKKDEITTARNLVQKINDFLKLTNQMARDDSEIELNVVDEYKKICQQVYNFLQNIKNSRDHRIYSILYQKITNNSYLKCYNSLNKELSICVDVSNVDDSNYDYVNDFVYSFSREVKIDDTYSKLKNLEDEDVYFKKVNIIDIFPGNFVDDYNDVDTGNLKAWLKCVSDFICGGKFTVWSKDLGGALNRLSNLDVNAVSDFSKFCKENKYIEDGITIKKLK